MDHRVKPGDDECIFSAGRAQQKFPIFRNFS
jgi:hypothetical protein